MAENEKGLDVLAVMDESIAAAESVVLRQSRKVVMATDPESLPARRAWLADAEAKRRAAKQARAAVAELIEAAEGVRAVTAGDEAGAAGWAAGKRLDAALARCGGAA